MGEGQSFPTVPADMATLAGDQQASILVQMVGQSAQKYATCELNRRILVDWINNTPVKDDE